MSGDDRPDAPAAKAGASTASGPARRAPEPPISFSEFAMSVGMNAMAMLESDGDLVPAKADLLQASQHIDILRMLKSKTAGNLDDAEGKLLDSLIYDLQMRYLEVARRQD